MAYMHGTSRYQVEAQFLSLDEIIDNSNPVRVIDAYVNSLDLSSLEFNEYSSSSPGQRPYDRKDLLKLHIYGYNNRIRSSRAIEKECTRNIEVMWLVNNITPDHVTIANFVKINKESFRKVLKNLVSLLRKWELVDDNEQAVDGTKIKAVNSQKQYLTIKKIDKKIADLDKHIDSYVDAISHSEKEKNNTIDVVEIVKKLSYVATAKEELINIKDAMQSKNETQRTLTDPDCRGMKNNGKVEPCYNVQTLVDSKNKLIIDCEVTNDINDSSQLTNLTMKNIVKEGTVVLADKGYFNMEQIAECVEANMDLYINRPRPNGNSNDAEYQKDRFKFDLVKNQYVCPAGKVLKYKCINNQRGIEYKTYICTECNDCPKKTKCTNSKTGRVLYRQEKEDIVEKIINKTINNPRTYKRRSEIVEHPYGTIKRYFGYTYFNRKGLVNVSAEASSFCIAYNLKRLINILGVNAIISKINEEIGEKISFISFFIYIFIKKGLLYLFLRKSCVSLQNLRQL